MQLTEIRINNYRLLIDAILDVDTKTSCAWRGMYGYYLQNYFLGVSSAGGLF